MRPRHLPVGRQVRAQPLLACRGRKQAGRLLKYAGKEDPALITRYLFYAHDHLPPAVKYALVPHPHSRTHGASDLPQHGQIQPVRSGGDFVSPQSIVRVALGHHGQCCPALSK